MTALAWLFLAVAILLAVLLTIALAGDADLAERLRKSKAREAFLLDELDAAVAEADMLRRHAHLWKKHAHILRERNEQLEREALPKAPNWAHSEGVSLSDVNLMLRQLERDRQTPYWGTLPHSESLDGAESWLLSMRDWLESRPVSVVRSAPIAAHFCGQTQPHAAHVWQTPQVCGRPTFISAYQCGGYVTASAKGDPA